MIVILDAWQDELPFSFPVFVFTVSCHCHVYYSHDMLLQVVGEGNCVKKAVAIISDRLKESLHRDRGPFLRGRNSPEHRISQADEYLGGGQQMPAFEEPYPRFDQIRNNGSMEPPGYEFDSNGSKFNEHPEIPFDEIIFRILCPNDKASSLVGSRDGIIDMLQAEVGVDVRLTDLIAGSDERTLIITSREVNGTTYFPLIYHPTYSSETLILNEGVFCILPMLLDTTCGSYIISYWFGCVST